jgi:hypothetical protein
MTLQPCTDFFHDQTLQVVKLNAPDGRGDHMYRVEQKQNLQTGIWRTNPTL